MRTFLLLSLLAIGMTASDIARQYPAALHPMLYAGSAAANTAGAGVPQPNGKELASLVNQHAGHDYKDDRTK